MNSFYLTLPSDSSMNFFPSNTQCCFKVKLPKTIRVDKENWEVALSQLITPSQFLNISDNEAKFDIITSDITLYNYASRIDNKRDAIYDIKEVGFAVDKSANKWAIRFSFAGGSYTSPSHVLEVINEVIQDTLGEKLAEKKMRVSVAYSQSTKRPKFGFYNVVKTGVKFHRNLFLKLGGAPDFLGKTIYPGKQNLQMFKYSPNIDAGYNHIFVYSDIVEHTIVGDMFAPILRVIPFKTSNSLENDNGSQHTNHEISDAHYVPVSKSEFDTVHINISGDSGSPVQFVTGKTIVKLHFRQRKQD